VALVGGRNADKINLRSAQLAYTSRLREALKSANSTACPPPVLLGTPPGSAGNAPQLDFHQAKSAIVQTVPIDMFEKRTISLVKNHANTNHAGS
jgi:hypothetical protein